MDDCGFKLEFPRGAGEWAAATAARPPRRPARPGSGPGPIYLQNRGNPVRYRNIWVVQC